MSDIAIKVENVSKTFKIPHEKISSLRGAFVNFFPKLSFKDGKKLSFRIRAYQLTGFPNFAIIQTPKTTRPDRKAWRGLFLKTKISNDSISNKIKKGFRNQLH